MHARFRTELFFYLTLDLPHKPPEDAGNLHSVSSHFPPSQWNVQPWRWVSQWATYWHNTRQSAVQGIVVRPSGHFSVSTLQSRRWESAKNNVIAHWRQRVGGWSNKEKFMHTRTFKNNSHTIRWNLINKYMSCYGGKMPLYPQFQFVAFY